MISSLLALFKTQDIRKRIIFTFFIFFIFRFLSHVPIPGANVEALKALFSEGGLLGVLNVFSGGAVSRFSLVTLGLGPYINASIIMQLFTKVFPKLEELSKEGEFGRTKINQYTRLISLPLSLIQSYGIYLLLSKQGIIGNISPFDIIRLTVVMAAGSMLLVWLGELISEFGIGNGISVIIFAGIIAGMPTSLGQTASSVQASGFFNIFVTVAISMLVVVGVVYINEATRNIKIQYARRMRGGRVYGGGASFLPLKVNMAGMIPIIFAVSLVLVPSFLSNFFSSSGQAVLLRIADFINSYLVPGRTYYNVMYFLLVFIFTYFYTAVTFNPDDVADNLKKQGGFIPGIRPGKHTSDYLNKIITRITLLGALFLGSLAVLPEVATQATGVTTLTVGGAGILIVVSVVLESIKSLQSQLIMRDYDSKII